MERRANSGVLHILGLLYILINCFSYLVLVFVSLLLSQEYFLSVFSILKFPLAFIHGNWPCSCQCEGHMPCFIIS